MKRIVAAVDGSEASLHAARLAADVALRFGASLVLVHAVPTLLLPPDVYGLSAAEVEAEHRAWAERTLEQAVEALAEPGLEVRTRVLLGSAPEAIAREAEDPEVGMVVVGRRGLGAVARAFVGSVSGRVVQLCSKPVLVVH